MDSRDQIISFPCFNAAIDNLMVLLDSVDLRPAGNSVLQQEHQDAFAAFYHAVFHDERSTASREDEMRFGASLAGLGDLAAKINRVAAMPGGLVKIRPHLENMIKGSARMNGVSPSIDAANNKHGELYVGCLAMLAGMAVELEDPDASGGGLNPDVLIDHGGVSWSIAVKASHSPKAPTIFGNIQKAVSQIERAGRPGIVFLNVKNIVDHKGLQAASPFATVDAATRAVSNELDAIVDRLRTEIVTTDWDDLFGGKCASRVVALMAQMTVSAEIFGGSMFVAVKAMRPLCAPPLAQDIAQVAGKDQAAMALLELLNVQLQSSV